MTRWAYFVLFGIYMLQRNVNWMYTLLKGTRLHRLPKGIFCLAKNLTEVIATIEQDQKWSIDAISFYGWQQTQ